MGTSTEHKVKLRSVEHTDLPLFFAWRSDREIMQYLPSGLERPTWEKHYKYWDSACHRDWTVMYGEEGCERERPVGIAHIIPGTGEVGIIIGEKSLWGKGIATKALGLMLERIQASKIARGQVWAVIHPENIASQRVFEKAGFVNTHEPARNGQERWVLE